VSPGVIGPSAAVAAIGARSTSANVTDWPPDDKTRSVPGWTDSLLPTATTVQASPTTGIGPDHTWTVGPGTRSHGKLGSTASVQYQWCRMSMLPVVAG
jgi:hypothetical protein